MSEIVFDYISPLRTTTICESIAEAVHVPRGIRTNFREAKTIAILGQHFEKQKWNSQTLSVSIYL